MGLEYNANQSEGDGRRLATTLLHGGFNVLESFIDKFFKTGATGFISRHHRVIGLSILI